MLFSSLGFEDLTKAYLKALPVIKKEENGVTPAFYIKNLVQLENFVNSQWENKKSMSKNNSKSLATLRQKLRKYNKDFEDDLVKFRENPDLLEDDDVEDDKDVEKDESDSESEEEQKKPSKKDADGKRVSKVRQLATKQ